MTRDSDSDGMISPIMVNRLKIPQGLSTLIFVGGVKFPQGEGSAVINRKKNRPALQRRDILTEEFAELESG